jgi:hypothetical protein
MPGEIIYALFYCGRTYFHRFALQTRLPVSIKMFSSRRVCSLWCGNQQPERTRRLSVAPSKATIYDFLFIIVKAACTFFITPLSFFITQSARIVSGIAHKDTLFKSCFPIKRARRRPDRFSSLKNVNNHLTFAYYKSDIINASRIFKEQKGFLVGYLCSWQHQRFYFYIQIGLPRRLPTQSVHVILVFVIWLFFICDIVFFYYVEFHER